MRYLPVNLGIVTMLGVAVFTPKTHAAEWEQSASLAVNSFYSDNICRAPNTKQDQAVGTATPQVRLRGDGARANLALNAAVEYNTLAGSSLNCAEQGGGNANRFNNRETWVPRINFTSQLEALENLLFLEANAFAAQNAINPFIAGVDDNINGAGNTNITYRWGVGGRIDRRFAERWAALIRYNYNEQYNSFNRGFGNSQEDRIELDVGMIPEASRFSLGVRGQYSEVAFDETDFQPAFTNRLSRLELRSALRVAQSLRLEASVGEEDNIFLSQSDEIDGSYWDAGLAWTPNARVQVSVGYGERFFGSTPRANISYRHKRSQLQASYQRDVQFPRNIRAANGGGNPDDPFDPGVGLPGEPLPGAGDPTFIGQSPVLNERFTLSYRFDARRVNFSLTATDSQQTRAVDGRTGNFQTLAATVSRSIGPVTSANLRVIWRENSGQLAGGGLEFQAQNLESISVRLGLQRRLAQNTSLNLGYAYTDQTSNNAFNNFEENRIDLGLRFTF